MKRLLILANSDIGLYNFRKELIQELIYQKYSVYISLPMGEKIKDLVELGCNFIETPVDRRGMNLLTDFRLILKYYQILRNVNPNIVLTYTIKPNIYGGIISRITGTPYISNITGLGSTMYKDSIIKSLLLRMYRSGLKKASCVFFQNKENRDFFLCSKVFHGNYMLIPGSGVNTSFHNYKDYQSDKVIRFLFIARIMKDKGIDELFEAANIIKNKYQDVEFHIIGDCEEEHYKDLLNELNEKKMIIYHGFQSDVRPFLAMSHCVILPSYHEGTANVLLEAASTGRAIIASDIPGCREIIDDGITGYTFEVRSVAQLCDKIESFISLNDSQRIRMGLMGREKMMREFDRGIVIKSYMEEISSILNT